MSPAEVRDWVLLVEDNEDHVLLIREALALGAGRYLVRHLPDGRAAMDWVRSLQSNYPAAIFLDLKLPGVSGTDVLRAIRADIRLAEVPVIVLSTSSRPEDVQLCRTYGASGYLTKDTGLETLARFGLAVKGQWP